MKSLSTPLKRLFVAMLALAALAELVVIIQLTTKKPETVLPDKEVLVKRETIEGYIGFEPQGENGFGYDPIFYVDEYGCSTAELSMEKKNDMSHRGNALRAVKADIKNRL